ncbi:hypothetical protein M514_26157 [Trichuris suis]|uniref:Uncharacterized protein n=1 Tax=Trichuris suis TaxID=68888 RepID=A0A085MWP2_9BILA|nr:hypothetical protein M514_28683 [Trichuris suis]KFD61638.1 hypothetical protein M514_26157 [Trichuris suis]
MDAMEVALATSSGGWELVQLGWISRCASENSSNLIQNHLREQLKMYEQQLCGCTSVLGEWNNLPDLKHRQTG